MRRSWFEVCRDVFGCATLRPATFTAGQIATQIGGRASDSERLTYDTMLELLEKAVALLEGQDVGNHFWAEITDSA